MDDTHLAKQVVELYLSTVQQLVTAMDLPEERSKPFLSLLETTLSDSVRSVTSQRLSTLRSLIEQDFCRRWNEVRKCFVKRDDRLVNLRLEQEFDKQKTRREQKAAAGVKGMAEMRKRYYFQTEQLAGSDQTASSQVSSQRPVGDKSASRQRPDPSISSSSSISTAVVRGTRCRPDFRPSEEIIDYAELECPELDVEKEIAAFLDYYLSTAGKGAFRVDWDRTFRAWLRKGQNYINQRNRSPLSAIKELERRDNAELARQRRAAEAAERQESDKDDELFDLLSGDN